MQQISDGISFLSNIFTGFWNFALEHEIVLISLLLAVIGSGILLFLKLKD